MPDSAFTTRPAANLTLPECLLLLALQDETGELERGINAERLNRGLIAAAILELVLMGKLTAISPNEPAISVTVLLRVIDRAMMNYRNKSGAGDFLSAEAMSLYRLDDVTPAGHKYVDRILRSLAALPDRIHTLGGFATFYARNGSGGANLPGETIAAAADLLANGILEHQEARGGLFRSQPVSHLTVTGIRDSGEDSLRLHLVNSIVGEVSQPDTRTQLLLCLIRATGLIETVFGKEKRDAADWRIASLCRPDSHPGTLYGFADHYTRSGPAKSDDYTLPE